MHPGAEGMHPGAIYNPNDRMMSALGQVQTALWQRRFPSWDTDHVLITCREAPESNGEVHGLSTLCQLPLAEWICTRGTSHSLLLWKHWEDLSHFSLVSCSGLPIHLLGVPALKQLSGTSVAFNFVSTLLLTAFASNSYLESANSSRAWTSAYSHRVLPWAWDTYFY